MKKYLLPTLGLLALATSSLAQTPDSLRRQPPVVVGGGRDAHGCSTSAGATWSQLRKTCIQVWREKNRLPGLPGTATASLAATVIFSADGKLAEVFAAEQKGSVLLTRTGKKGSYSWQKDAWTLRPTAGGYQLKDKQTVLYASGGR